ncbi:FxLYD domain-containing protein [Variovorax ginsengisoli]|uniref:TFIIB-type zinc ribbon-containing protein n=1 Tax=Variovorax ginsengisoli TaxID=363844 RepID=A0ABT9S7K0_9BURK|nr:FxLYD domain-containing protein [Variovorax ginsengisoli]MDP9900342.1 hypothetical protein [Variovorax ginsengisoli]
MTINLQTLKCAECGSGMLQRTGLNQYVCAHCGSVSVVEDDVSDRLDRVLDQVKDAAAQRLNAEQGARQKQAIRTAALVLGGIACFVILTLALSSFVGNRRGNRPSPMAIVDKPIPVDLLKLVDVREVLTGGSQSAKLLVVARNETGKVLERPGLEATFYDGETKLGSDSETLPVDLLMPGESAAVLLDLPRGEGRVTRQELTVKRLSEPRGSVEGPSLAFSRVRLVQQGPNDLRLVGRLVNTREGVTIAGAQVLVTLYDDRGAVIGFGQGYAQASELKPGERSSTEVRLVRFGGSSVPVAAWDYRIGYSVTAGDGSRAAVRSAQRTVRTASGPEAFNPDLRMSTEDLLADDSERFDLAQLELLPLIPGLNTIRQRTYMTELVNRSKDVIAVTPSAVISRFDGNELDGTTRLDGLAYLYPGERFPVQVDPRRADRITQTRVEWKPLRKAALPGPRVPLEVRVEGTKAELGSVLLNFSQRFVYKAVTVKGSVKNPGTGIVRKPRVWVSLRDRQGQLTGFKSVDNLTAIAPGDSVPFEVRIEQQGRDFATVDTVYQTGD